MDCDATDKKEEDWPTSDEDWHWWPEEGWNAEQPQKSGDEGIDDNDADYIIQRGKGGGKGNCYTCGKSGHLARDCPMKGKGKGGIK